MRAASFWLLGTLGAVLAAGCASHYDAALRDLALPPGQRLASRVASMEDSARQALRTLEAAADAVRADAGTGSPQSMARQARLVNDADAAVFEYSRQVLIIADASSAADADSRADLEPLRASMLAARESLAIAMRSLRDCTGGAGPAAVHSAPPSGPDDLARAVDQARTDVAALSHLAESIRAVAGSVAGDQATPGTGP